MKCKICGTEILKQAAFCPNCGSKIEQPPIVNIPVPGGFLHDISNIWPEWQIEKQLGKGSYGVVYQAIRKDDRVESHAAIKIISIPSDSSEVDSLRSEGLDMNGTRTYFKGIVDDFVSEIQLMESLKGIQNIVSVEDYKVVEKTDAIGWDIYIRMELLTPFNTYICDKTITENELIKLGTDICTALEICGQRNIIHRDIKPENIFVNDFGYFKLGDFGIARKLENMTGGLSQKGTFNYMAPEVATSNEYDARVDIYSLGIVLYRLLNNNKLPFLDTDKQLLNPNERKMAVERRIRGAELPAPCNASPSMANLILRACAHNPNARFSSATEMKQALISVANGTYTPVNTNFNKPPSVHSARANYNTAAAGANAAITSEQGSQSVANSFGESPKNKRSKGKKAKFIAISVLSVIVALAITLAILFFSSAAYGVYRDMNSDNYDDALIEYRSDVKGKFIQEMLLDMLLKDRVNEVATEYKNGDIDYDTAIAELNALDKMGFDGAKEKIDEITVTNDSVNALAKADEYYENGDYEKAISEYSKVPESNEKYKEAQDKLSQVYVDYINSIVETAKKHNSSKNYKQAVQIVNAAFDILPNTVDTSKLDAVKEESLVSYQSQVTEEVTSLTDDSQYENAFKKIDDAIAVDDNVYFQNLRTTTEDSYVSFVSETVQKHLDNEDYVSAKRVAENALTILPDNADLKTLQSKVEEATPIYLLDVVKPYESLRTYTEFINGETFKMGGTSFTNGFQFNDVGNLCSGDGKASFNLNSKYTKLDFHLGTVDGMGALTNTLLVYCDGILKTEYTIVGGELPKKYSIDVTGVKQLTFVINGTYDGGCTYGFGNVTVD